MRTVVASCLLLVLLGGCEDPVDPTVKDTEVEILSERLGVGKPAAAGDLVTIDYRVIREDGKEILRQEGYRFIVGTGSVIEGVDDAVTGMQVSGDRVVKVPPHRHWGRGGYGDGLIPENEFLTITIELEAID